MKQNDFLVVANDRDRSYTTKSWRSSIRRINELVSTECDTRDTTFTLTDSASKKDGTKFIQGSRTYQGRDGHVMTFTIQMQRENN